jgi:soluble lytic murein transglycosylase
VFYSRTSALIIVTGIACGSLWASSRAHGRQTDQSTAAPAQAETSKAPATSKTTKSATTKSSKSTSAKTASTKSKTAHASPARKKHRKISPRVRRIRQAFVASTTLKPMAQQLLQERTPAGYAAVTAYAQRHAKEDAGALAWLVVGYGHVLDHDYAKAIDPLNRARARAGDLGDYVTYYLGSSYLQVGRSAEAGAALAEFSTNYPDSLLAKDAHVVYAGALMAEGRAADAAALLEQDRVPQRADVELGLGRAYAATGQTEKALAALRNVYYRMPTSPEADTASGELRKLGAAIPPVTLADRRTRADLLAKGKRYADAAEEYRGLLDEVPPADRPLVLLALATALQKSGRNKDANQVLGSTPESTPEIAAQRLYWMAEVARSSDDIDGFLRLQGQLRQAAPTSPWLEQSLLAAGNMYLLKKDYDRAIDAYREMQQRFPNGTRASYAHWKVAWLSLRQGRKTEAEQGFEEQLALYSGSGEVPAALYWRARLAEEDGEPAKAAAYYQKLSERFRNFYYAELARQRLKVLAPVSDPVHYALLDRVPPLNIPGKVTTDEPPVDDLHVQKAHLLENGGLVDFAVRELQAANEQDGNWALAETARLYQDSGRYDRAIEVMKHGVPNYFAVDVPELPRTYWEALFPKAYWGDLKRFSTQNELDPYLVASLIRQESEFNPNALSRANAVGLMQLLPITGKKVAREVNLHHYNPSQLFTPTVNLQLGTRYFKTMVDKFGSFEYALAAYNAGSDRVQDWLAEGKYRDPQEFVESIPFTETREYVQAILRNANVYKQLYGTP